MSKTYRRKSGRFPKYHFTEYVSPWTGEPVPNNSWRNPSVRVYLDPDSPKYKALKVMYNSDSWYKNYYGKWKHDGLNTYMQKPYRRKCKMELIKFTKDEDYEVVLRSKPKRIWS